MIEGIEKEILRGILTALEQKFNAIGSVIDGEARGLILSRNIRDTGNFYDNATYEVVIEDNAITLYVGSDPKQKGEGQNEAVSYGQYILGGKVPSWTPLAPLKAWVERKNLNWVDKRGKAFSVTQMAYMIQAKIKREGIPERNVYAEIIKNKEKWIYDQLDSVLVN